MTKHEQNELCNSLEEVSMSLEKAVYILQEISEEYFEKFDPDDKEGKFAIVYEFKRRRAFTRVLTDLLHQIEADLPAVDWVGRLSVEDQREGVPA